MHIAGYIKLVYLYRYTDLKHFNAGWKSTSNWQTNNLIISLFHRLYNFIFFHASENVYEFYAIYESLFEAFCECECSEQNQKFHILCRATDFLQYQYDENMIFDQFIFVCFP